MVIVSLIDGTQYLMNTDSKSEAMSDVERKLRQRLDGRKINGAIFIPANIQEGKYKNPIDSYKCNHTPLKAFSGWSYKWGDGSTEFYI